MNIITEQIQNINDTKKIRRLLYFTEEYTTCECCNTQVKRKNYRDHITRKCTKSDWFNERLIIWRGRH